MNVSDISILTIESGLVILKLLVLFGMLLYLGFSILVIRQAQLMTRTVTGELDKLISALSWGHFLLGTVIFLAALFVL